VILTVFFGSLAVLSLVLLLWQWLAAVRFPLHQRIPGPSFAPPVSLLKPLKGCDAATEDCLRSWFTQDYDGPIQILFAVDSASDPVCEIVRRLQQEFPRQDAELVVHSQLLGANAKISKLAQLEQLAKHDLFVVSDADVRVPKDFLANAAEPLTQAGVGLVNCFYRLANPTTTAMQWEAIAINADFWSQVLQSKSLRPLNFALGAAIVVGRRQVEEIGGFQALANCLADDYQLGNRITAKGHRIALCPLVVECWEQPMNWRQIWTHQLRWARTIRVCQPLPYFFSILSNVGLWASLWLVFAVVEMLRRTEWHSLGNGFATSIRLPLPWSALIAAACIAFRILVAFDLQRRLTRTRSHGRYFWLVPFKDLLQTAVWCCAFLGNAIEWRGEKFTLHRDGTLRKQSPREAEPSGRPA
jgi:ceramide glucosyltransferase